MPRRLRSRTLPGWRDPESVFVALASAAPRVAWLDGGDAAAGRSVIAVHREGAPLLIASGAGEPAAVYADLASAIFDDLSDERDDATVRAAVGWYGWFGYEFGARTLGVPAATTITPEAAFLFADRVIVFDHAAHSVRLEWFEADAADGGHGGAASARWADETAAAIVALAPDRPQTPAGEAPTMRAVVAARWRSDADDYRRMIAECRAAIVRGDAYQLCLTNRVDVDVDADPVETYLRLRRMSPSHHGGFLRFDDISLLSASPEQFLLVERDRTIASKPMKGTRPRSDDPATDVALRAELSTSEKERAENLMIVDLMRNDLGRIAELGSVAVPSLLAVEEYAQVHQLVSTVTARLRHPLTALDAVRSAFPAGSMTGAPKESAMRILHDLEGGPRGVYSGVFGYLGVDGSADLAMVIRSIVLTPSGASIGTGGGITALSVADEEIEVLGAASDPAE
jgi:anthranilate/para-aminobenzoate synthase component I